jgi:hypothetical protein
LNSDEEEEEVEITLKTKVVKERPLPPTLAEFDSKGVEIDPRDKFLDLKIGERSPSFRIVEPLYVNGAIKKCQFKEKEGKFEGQVFIELEGVPLEKVEALDKRCYKLMAKMGKTAGKVWKPLSHPHELRLSAKTGVQVRVMNAKITEFTKIVILGDSKPGEAPTILSQGSGEEFFNESVAPLKNVSITGELTFKSAYEMDKQSGVGKPAFWCIHVRQVRASKKHAAAVQSLSQDELNKFFDIA